MDKREKVIALGFFDGVHRGHGALLRRVARRAEELGAVPAAFTFDVHPASRLKGAPVPQLTSPADRAGLMKRLYGIEEVIVGRFEEMKALPWRSFVTDYLVGELGVVHVVAGHDFRFGHRGEGNPELLQGLCRELGIGCDIIEKVELEGVTVSSTYIRELIAGGDVERANEFLGHPYALAGKVVHGKALGRTIGIPTANVELPRQSIVPAWGVYATKVLLEDGRERLAVTNVGVRPSVEDGEAVTVEPWILDFNEDLYGQTLRVEFYKRLRGEKKFSSLEELAAEIRRNGDETREYFKNGLL